MIFLTCVVFSTVMKSQQELCLVTFHRPFLYIVLPFEAGRLFTMIIMIIIIPFLAKECLVETLHCYCYSHYHSAGCNGLVLVLRG